MSEIIDFRSDTVTKPTKNMLQAMFNAQVGDDVFGDDPTVNALQEKIAVMFGMEAALFCPSGTMTNQIAINVHTLPGDEIICEENSHIYLYEGGGIAKNSGCSVSLLKGDKGIINATDIEQAIRADDPHFPKSTLVSLENTSNKGGGTCYDMETLLQIQDVCKQNNLQLHLDGARLFNALVATQQNALQYGQIFDSISICLSKGLGCPIGSLILGSHQFIKQAIRVRKAFGGGMRQAGYLAAAGIYALDNNINRLKEDHQKAERLHEALENAEWVIKTADCQTNIVVAYLENSETVDRKLIQLSEFGILAVRFGVNSIRFVCHLNVSFEEVEKAALIIESLPN